MQDRLDPISQKFESILPFLLITPEMRPKRAMREGLGGEGAEISRVSLNLGQVPNMVISVWARVTV